MPNDGSSPVKFITLDGIDGVGKSTQIEKLADHLRVRGSDVVTVRDPGTTPAGTRLREILLDGDIEMHRRTEALLFLASRCEMVETVIRPALEAGRTVISDRFLLSTVVYQSVGDGVDPDLLWKMGDLADGGLRPDHTILLDMPAAESVRRIDRAADRMESRGVEYLESVRQAFLTQLPRASERTSIIDASKSVDEVATAIAEATKSTSRHGKPLI